MITDASTHSHVTMQNRLTLAAREELARLPHISSTTWNDVFHAKSLTPAGWLDSPASSNDTDKDNHMSFVPMNDALIEQMETENSDLLTLEETKTVEPEKAKPSKPNQLIDINPFTKHNLELGKWVTIDLKSSPDVSTKQTKKQKASKITDLSLPLVFKKKHIQPRFSRRRYLREYNSLNMMPFLLTITSFISVLIIAMVINLGILIPGIKQNRALAENLDALNMTIATLKPEFHLLATEQEQLKAQAHQAWMGFPTENDLRHQMIAFMNIMGEDRSVQLIHYDMTTISGNAGLHHLIIAMEIKTGFINWMEYRDFLNADFTGIRVETETINAPPRQNLVNITARFYIPFRDQQAG